MFSLRNTRASSVRAAMRGLLRMAGLFGLASALAACSITLGDGPRRGVAVAVQIVMSLAIVLAPCCETKPVLQRSLCS